MCCQTASASSKLMYVNRLVSNKSASKVCGLLLHFRLVTQVVHAAEFRRRYVGSNGSNDMQPKFVVPESRRQGLRRQAPKSPLNSMHTYSVRLFLTFWQPPKLRKAGLKDARVPKSSPNKILFKPVASQDAQRQ
ncbi:hypothetical protein BCR43DRAFT_497401 [Syncephalastrum racemosum]|uniref:Uncharacterized protein n=1 Tax=Syncephalastrum racemosum TaxID=13706 RepID=A0A1X2H224_SYNRA|nr:hypothetical protein BCR43DRAFT_497401 [Syncephalastrum racemosum]